LLIAAAEASAPRSCVAISCWPMPKPQARAARGLARRHHPDVGAANRSLGRLLKVLNPAYRPNQPPKKDGGLQRWRCS